jgi:serine/threonine protein phosphatase PrpC
VILPVDLGRLTVATGSHTERGRRGANEDYASCLGAAPGISRHRCVAAAIADGVGGAKGGRVAAELAVRGFFDALIGLDPLHGVRRNGIAGLEAMNAWLHAQGRADPALEGMACTFTALILRGRLAHVLHVGDTRLYRLREQALTRLTTDHVVGRGDMRHVLTRAVGAETGLRIDAAVEPARQHDRYLLCSDGVHGALSDRRIADLLSRRAGPEATAADLVEAAIATRLGDNATALVVDVLALPQVDPLDIAAAIEALPIAPPPRPGAVIDGYRLDAMLTDGRNSRVFRATDERDASTVVVKFPKADIGAEPVLRLAFLREAWIAARLSSPFVAEVIEDATDRRASLYTVMPFYAGETLEARLARFPVISRVEGLGIAARLAKAVATLHRAGVVHRDIKPDNVLLTVGGGLRLLDLGVALAPDMAEFPTEDVPGTPSYMAPELFAGGVADQRSDQYALAVTVYRSFTRAYPYGEIEPFTRPRFAHPPTPLLVHRPDLPAWLDQVLRRALAARPDDRFADVIELLFALEHGALGAAPAPPRRRPWIERDPLRFWQVVAALLAIATLVQLTWRR